MLTFKDPQTGKKMQYNLYTPKNLEPGRKHPLVMFIADASTAGKGVKAPLMQGYGGIIWATDEAQAKHPAFVLVPSYTQTAVNDQWQTSDEVGMTLRLIRSLMTQNRSTPTAFTALPSANLLENAINAIEKKYVKPSK